MAAVVGSIRCAVERMVDGDCVENGGQDKELPLCLANTRPSGAATPKMVAAGISVLYDWGMDYRGNSRALISDELVVEIFRAMVAAKESVRQDPSNPD